MPPPSKLTAELAPPAVGIVRRRRISDIVLQAPQSLRSLVRGDEIFLVVLAAMLGAAAG